MELFSYEQRARSVTGCAVFLLVLFLAGCFFLVTTAMCLERNWSVIIAGSAAVFLLFLCGSFIYGFAKNEVWRFGIRDNVIWWDSPRWPRSLGFISLDDVCKVTIYDNTHKMKITMRDGKTRRIFCSPAGKKVQAIFREHYPSVAIEFIQDSS